MESGLECSISKSPSLKSLFLLSSGPIQPGDLGLTGGCQATHLSAGTQGSLSLDNNSQEHRDPGQGARDELSVTHRAQGGGWTPGVLLGHKQGWGQTHPVTAPACMPGSPHT